MKPKSVLLLRDDETRLYLFGECCDIPPPHPSLRREHFFRASDFMSIRRFSNWMLLLLTLSSGCASSRPMIVSNPVFLPANSQHSAWERTVDALHDFHFPIARENRLDGVIETDYRVGSNVLEPWHGDSVGVYNRMESTLQSIRRKVRVDLTPVEGGYLVGVEAFKEQEDLLGVAENTAGAATFRKNTPLERDLNVVVGQSSPSGWISLGRDADLEQAILAEMQR